ncbi:hypothetical protein CWC25_12270 [Pseudoalteromonas sp. S4389]|uniref:HEPN domain-containing protein n=1 Tax=Pseudoalteromonas sp. S4389 TaxID=579556 RepID=UPI001109006F|nr:HEPN domain-containing protein [Pseudoalteromonas sp. S4389]TMO43407.1 hypothetical protein CWC25_12270 [Pseudoalteromonas sp. S4389]|tara:strand:+ start:320 stop:721 length:402 start_codon:yes stop_codon:yes gene_type:complete
MPVCPSDFYSQAEVSLDNNIGEISYRCCIKNSYYAAYHRAHEVLSCAPIEYKGVGVHKSFIEYLEGEAHKYEPNIEKNSLRRLSMMLNNLRNARAQADYKLGDDISEGDAKMYLDASSRVFNLCEEIDAQKVA